MGFGRAAAALLFVLIALRYFWLDQPLALIGSINLVFHEAGHVFFSPLGRYWGVAGGSLFEVGLPLGILALALRDRHLTATGGCLVWLSTALHSVSVYAGDAQARVLPLLGGEAVVHDWWWLLRHHGALERTQEVAAMIWSLGLGAAVLGCIARICGVIWGNGTAAQAD